MALGLTQDKLCTIIGMKELPWFICKGGKMGIEFLSIVIFTFALALLGLGCVTWWIERGRKRILGSVMIAAAILVAGSYAFLASRFAIALFGRLIITIDLPRLMAQAIIYTIGVLAGLGLAVGAFLWVSGRLIQPTRLERKLAVFIGVILLIALGISVIAVLLSR